MQSKILRNMLFVSLEKKVQSVKRCSRTLATSIGFNIRYSGDIRILVRPSPGDVADSPKYTRDADLLCRS
jgi:hypothetical protein